MSSIIVIRCNNSSHIAYFIETFKPNNVFPAFVGQWRYVWWWQYFPIFSHLSPMSSTKASTIMGFITSFDIAYPPLFWLPMTWFKRVAVFEETIIMCATHTSSRPFHYFIVASFYTTNFFHISIITYCAGVAYVCVGRVHSKAIFVIKNHPMWVVFCFYTYSD